VLSQGHVKRLSKNNKSVCSSRLANPINTPPQIGIAVNLNRHSSTTAKLLPSTNTINIEQTAREPKILLNIKAIATKNLDELHKELTRIEMQNREHIESIPLIRLLADLQRHVKSRINEAEALVKQLNDIKAQLKASNKKSLRIPCPHPNEKEYAIEILGVPPEYPLFKQRTGFNSYAICLDCLYQFEADFRDEKVNEWRLWYGYPTFKEAFRGKPQMKDERRCPRCGSANVKTVFELIGQPCPRCKVGVIREIETGAVA
jgi:hypothetical protein